MNKIRNNLVKIERIGCWLAGNNLYLLRARNDRHRHGRSTLKDLHKAIEPTTITWVGLFDSTKCNTFHHSHLPPKYPKECVENKWIYFFKTALNYPLPCQHCLPMRLPVLANGANEVLNFRTILLFLLSWLVSFESLLLGSLSFLQSPPLQPACVDFS